MHQAFRTAILGIFVIGCSSPGNVTFSEPPQAGEVITLSRDGANETLERMHAIAARSRASRQQFPVRESVIRSYGRDGRVKREYHRIGTQWVERQSTLAKEVEESSLANYRADSGIPGVASQTSTPLSRACKRVVSNHGSRTRTDLVG